MLLVEVSVADFIARCAPMNLDVQIISNIANFVARCPAFLSLFCDRGVVSFLLVKKSIELRWFEVACR